MIDNEVVKKGKKARNNEAFKLINEVKTGESMILLKEDWKFKTLPGKNNIRRRLKREFKMETLTDGTGWKITAL